MAVLLLAVAAGGLVVLGGRRADADRIVCRGSVYPARLDPPRDASTTGLGPLPAPYRLRAPLHRRPRGVAILLHGGAWSAVGPAQLAVMQTDEVTWLRRGWATANVDYRACERSFADVVRAHDAIRRRIGPRTPVVVEGQSAGAQLALLLAAARPRSIQAVVAEAPPTDPRTIHAQPVFDPTDGRTDERDPPWIPAVWRSAFGPRWLTVGSPVAQASRIRARVVLAHAARDRLIPAGQITGMARALRRAHPHGWVRVLPALPTGSVHFPHAPISPAAAAAVARASAAAVAPWQTGPDRTPAAVAGWWGRAPRTSEG